ncbi:hypothetical protein ROHU_021461 [Labeo rohita]|uniref:Uncharacterized protein n=1 Tax=Labeo rohita TaxID=84645 RepID=A0A498N4S8_LABRO|nr:hypothetical protein ROHU_033785 [Labeo rohita]RXN25546.1 hypothetical protein ROHU_021461 [Labeo rohita]
MGFFGATLSRIQGEDIDEEAFLLLDEDTIKNLVPKVGPRLKFLKLFRVISHQSRHGMVPLEHIIAQDFQVLHGEAAPKLFETWIPEYAEKVLYLAKQDNKLPSLSVEDMTLDAKGELALTLLPTMVPQAVYRVGKKTIRHSIEESRTAFIHQMPVKEGNPSDMFHVKAKG